MLLNSLLVLIVAAVSSLVLIIIDLPAFLRDTDTSSPQKIHNDPKIPHLGGFAVLLGMVAGLFQSWLILLFLLAFITGFIEDVFKDISPFYRLFLSFIVVALACWLLQTSFDRSGANWVDEQLLSHSLVAYALAIFMVAGVMHAVNIIDGYNGLMPGWAILSSGALFLIAMRVGDEEMAFIFLTLVASLMGILIFNYPWGKIFMGDGGAYLVGFILALCSLMLINRNLAVSPWFPLVVVAYPVCETLFSIFRRWFFSRQSPVLPDRLHAQNIIHRLLCLLFPNMPRLSHCLVGPILCLFSLTSIIPAIYYWNKTIPLVVIGFTFFIFYIFCYLTLLRLENSLKSGAAT